MMKRYGYKFEKLDGSYTAAIDVRVFSLFFGIVLFILFGIIFGYRSSCFGVGLLYFGAGFLSEFFPRIGLSIALLIFLCITVIFVNSEYQIINECYENCGSWSRKIGKEEKVSTIGQSLLLGGVFLIYNFVVIWLFYVPLKSKS
jgi:hypothetical protein